ncbi:50S ribosomal protein L19 [Candidatus Roizmanbacteria bacterium]|nr:50S ribosomal protein L19 [Candidatus Roizmanbacteria bacterium]
MANSITYQDKDMSVGDTIAISYKIKEGDKERQQLFEGILLKIKGDSDNNRMITVRKLSKTGVGVERIIPLSSPFIGGIKVVKKSSYQKSKLYFIRFLSESKLRHKLYSHK